MIKLPNKFLLHPGTKSVIYIYNNLVTVPLPVCMFRTIPIINKTVQEIHNNFSITLSLVEEKDLPQARNEDYAQ